MLTEDQIATIREETVSAIVENCRNDDSYLHNVIGHYVDTFEPEEQTEFISSERDQILNILGFDPETGEAYVEDECCTVGFPESQGE